MRAFTYFILALILYSLESDLKADLENVLKSNRHDPKCAFNFTQVNSTTIKFFPKCKKVYGIVVINSQTDLNETQIKVAFESMQHLVGGIRVENSKLESLSFLTPPPYKNFNISCETYGVYILNNSNLYDANLLMTTDFLFDNKENRECDVRIEDNEMLDAELLCDDGYFKRYMDLKIKGNSKDCGCQGDEITSTSLPDYRKCKNLYIGLKLQNIIDPTAASHLSGVRIIKGSIDIQNTNFQNLSFLEKFKRLEINNNGVVEKISFNLKDNPNMTRLALPGFEEIRNYAYDGIKLANFENLHPDFCLTYAEIIQLLERELTFLNFHVKICEGSPDIPGQKVCIYESMAKLPNNCDVIIGDIVVDSGDEILFMKLDVFNYLFGSLTIRNTNLKFLDGLAGLHAIIHLNPGPVIKVISNKELIMQREELKFVGPSFIYTRNRSNRDVVFQDNNPDIFKEFQGKCVFYYWIGYREEREYQTNMNFTGGDCGQRIDVTSLVTHTTVYVIILLIAILLIK